MESVVRDFLLRADVNSWFSLKSEISAEKSSLAQMDQSIEMKLIRSLHTDNGFAFFLLIKKDSILIENNLNNLPPV